VVGLATLQALGDDSDQDLVGDEVAAVHVLLRLGTDVGALLDRGPEDVTGRVVGEVQVLLEAFALGSLATSRRSEQD